MAIMNKQTMALCDELCSLLGHKSWTKVGQRCTGKWAGTTDYSLRWEDGTRMFISNGMSYFEEVVRETVEMLKRTRDKDNQRAIMEVLWEYEKDDAKMAREAGLMDYKVLGLIEVKDAWATGMIWWGVRLLIGDRIVDFKESGLSMDIKGGAAVLRKTKEREAGRKLWTAGGVQTPNYVIHGVGHDYNYDCYKPYEEDHVIFYPWEEAA